MLELIKPVTWFPPMWAYACGAVASGVAITEHLGLLIVGMILAGPVVWVARDRYPEQRRERLALVAFGIGMIVFPLTLGLLLAFGAPPFIPSSDALIVGAYVGLLFAHIAEHTVVPERLRAVN